MGERTCRAAQWAAVVESEAVQDRGTEGEQKDTPTDVEAGLHVMIHINIAKKRFVIDQKQVIFAIPVLACCTFL